MGLLAFLQQNGLLRQTPSPRVTIVESAHRLGGVIQTVNQGGWLIECSADSFLSARPEGIELVERLGLSKELVSIRPEARRALVWSPQEKDSGILLPVPPGFRLLAPGPNFSSSAVEGSFLVRSFTRRRGALHSETKKTMYR